MKSWLQNINLKIHFLRWGPNYLLALLVALISVFIAYLLATSNFSFSSNREDWKDAAEFLSFLISPYLAMVAAFFLWKQIVREEETMHYEEYKNQITSYKKRFLNIFDTIDDVNIPPIYNEIDLLNTLTNYILLNVRFQEYLVGSHKYGYLNLKSECDEFIFENLWQREYIQFESEVGFIFPNSSNRMDLLDIIKQWLSVTGYLPINK